MEGLANLAGLLADRTRAAFCAALLDGRAWTSSELAAHAGVSPSTASEHLTRLINGGLLAERRQGRHRYVQLANHQVAQLLEDLIAHAEPQKPARTLQATTASAALARARTCYDHLAGRLGVAITDAMTTQGLLTQTDGFTITDKGLTWLTTELNANLNDLRTTKRPLGRPCLDWTERRTHLAGTAGAHLCHHFQTKNWVKQIGTTRALHITPAGKTALQHLLNLNTDTLT